MKSAKKLPELMKKCVSQNNSYAIILHVINLTSGFILYFLFIHQHFLEYYGGFVVAYFLLCPTFKKIYLSSKTKMLKYIYCILFIISVSYLAMFLTMTFIVNIPTLHAHFIDSLSSDFLFSVGIVSLGIYVILWPIVLALGFINFLLLNKLS